MIQKYGTGGLENDCFTPFRFTPFRFLLYTLAPPFPKVEVMAP